MKLAPTLDRIVVKPDPRKDKTVGGIIIPDNTKERPLSGTVLAVGPGKHDGGVFVPQTIIVGSRVLFPKLAGQEVDTTDGKYLIMHSSDVLAVDVSN